MSRGWQNQEGGGQGVGERGEEAGSVLRGNNEWQRKPSTDLCVLSFSSLCLRFLPG